MLSHAKFISCKEIVIPVHLSTHELHLQHYASPISLLKHQSITMQDAQLMPHQQSRIITILFSIYYKQLQV